MRAVVTGSSCTTALGHGRAALVDGWIHGRRGITPVHRFDTSALGVHLGGEMPEPLSHGGASRGARHVDDVLAAVLDEAGLPAGARVRAVVATAKGFLASGDEVARRAAVHDVGLPARHVATRLRERFGDAGVAPLTISTACASGTVALAAGATMLEAPDVDAVVLVGVDLLSDFVYSGFAALSAVDSGPCRPFDTRRAGMTPAEAVAAVVLERPGRAGARVLGRVLGWGLANDAAHPTAPDRDARGMSRAITSALRAADVAPARLTHVHAHGTGTVYNDAMEIVALRNALGTAAATVPVTTVKGNVGHAFGAAGLVEAVASLGAARRGVLPAVAGLASPEPGLDLVRDPRELRPGPFLKLGAGFGGFDAAVVLEACDGA